MRWNSEKLVEPTSSVGLLNLKDFLPKNEVAIAKKKPPKHGARLSSASVRAKETIDSSFKNEMAEARKELASLVPNALPTLSIARMKCGLSQQQLAEIVNTSQSHIARIEAKTVAANLATAYKISKALSISMDEITPMLLKDTKTTKFEVQVS